MSKLKICCFMLFLFFIIDSYSQKSEKHKNSSLSRFQYKGYISLEDYIRRNADFSEVAAMNTGVILAGIMIDNDGQISKVFTLNSLASSVDNNILAILEKTEGHWKSINDSISHNSLDTIVIPIVFRFIGTEYKIDKANCKLALQKEVEILKYINGQPVGISGYESTKTLIKKYDRAFAGGKYDEASEILKSLVKREPLNSDYYSKLILVNIKQGRKYAACNNLKYFQNFLVIQPDASVLQGLECN